MSEVRANTISDAAGTGPVTLTGQSAAKAWVNFNGTGTVAIRDDLNVSSLTDNGVGNYSVNLTSAMASADYAFIGSTSSSTIGPNGVLTSSNNDTKTVSAVQIRTGLTSPANTPQDGAQVSVAIHGDLA